uniref:Ribonuclease H n=1 Tax=Candidatus Giovannonibacteria bacterium GW2011_GWF2_42_19 TaxID=1618659 RepID=A0A0G0ZDH6_9BACT|nr:MAG: Ribonuclease H [Candidatus Giovannonibacteria bacterium GW2011_GWF2_42_19]
MEKSKKIIVYTDGGSRGNPGPAALGVVIKDEKGNLIKKYGEALGAKTNNEAEYAAVVSALKKIKALFGKEKTKKMVVDMRMDSELVAKQLTGKYKIEVERLFPLFIKIWNLKMDFKNISGAE